MFFEAESNGIKFQVKVAENRTLWKVSIKQEDRDWIHYDIPKEDYMKLDNTISFIFKDSSYLVDCVGSDTDYTVFTRGSHRTIKIFNDEMLLHESLKSGKSLGGGDNLTAGMPGKIVKIFVAEGDEVKEGDPLLIMEAMKMENEMRASHNVKIAKVAVEQGQNVESGQLLIDFE